MLWLEFFICSAVIVYCGVNLSRYGDAIAEKTGMGRAWIGLILMAGVTSLPELITGVSSVVLTNAPNIALGDVMGSCVFNLAIIALMDLLYGPRPIFSKAEHSHTLSAGFGVILIGTACVSILAADELPSFGHVGIATPLIMLIYVVGMRSVFLYQKRQIAEHAGEMAEHLQYEHMSAAQAGIRYAANAVAIIGAAVWLPYIGVQLAEATGLGRSFIGAVLIAEATSLPELVISIAALRIGAADMAIANLLGSNMFNIFILAVDDMAYLRGPLFGSVSTNHAITGFIALMMTGIIVVSLTYRLQKKTMLRLGWDALALFLAFVVNILLLYLLRGRG